MATRPKNGGTTRQDDGNSRQAEKKEPVHSVNYYSGGGYVEATVWENTVSEGTENERLAYGVSVKRSYKDGNAWKDTKSFRTQDLPHLCEALRQAYLWIQEQQSQR